MNSGTTPSWVGTAMVAMTNTSRARRPRKRSLANENPARVANSTTLIDVMTATMTEFARACQNLMSELNTRVTLSMKLGPGINEGIGFCAIVWASEDARRNV